MFLLKKTTYAFDGIRTHDWQVTSPACYQLLHAALLRVRFTFSCTWLVSLFQVLNVLKSLCVGNNVAVRTNQNLICDNLLPGCDLLLQTKLVDHVFR